MTLYEYEKRCDELIDEDDIQGLLDFMDANPELQQQSFDYAMSLLGTEVDVDVDAAYQRFKKLLHERSS